MTQSKAYNLKIYCDIKNISEDSEEALEFLDKKFYEQLTIIKKSKTTNTYSESEDEGEGYGYSILDRIIKK